MGFDLPNEGFDGVLYNDGGGDVLFGDELAHGFSYGGFRTLNASERTRKVLRTLYGEPDFELLRARLPSDFLPV
jgi:hypothetical protein